MGRKFNRALIADRLSLYVLRAAIIIVLGVCPGGPGSESARAQQPGVSARAASAAPTPSAPPAATSGAETAATAEKRYRIGPGDMLDIRTIAGHLVPELSRENVLVENDGTIRIPMIEEDVPAACLTVRDLGMAIRALYKKYKVNPYVDVFVKEYNSQPVSIVGAVMKPGQFQLRRRVRLLEMLNLAGGPNERAGGRVQLVRAGGVPHCDATEVAPESDAASAELGGTFALFSLKETQSGDAKSNPYLQPGDVINLPDADQAYVVGNVLRPTAVPLKDPKEPVTVSMAIAMAGGALPDTKSGQVRIIRQTPGTNAKSEIMVDLKAIDKHQAADVALQPNDIVNVPTSGGKRLIRSLIGTIAPTLSQLPVRVVP